MITIEHLAHIHWQSRNQGRDWNKELRSVQAEEVEATRAVLQEMLEDPAALRMRASGFLRLIVMNPTPKGGGL